VATKAAQPTIETRLRTGDAPGLIGRMVELHGTYHRQFDGFGAAFEEKVAGDLTEFMTRIGNPDNGIWTAENDGQIVGGIAIDGEDLGDGRAHLRWFIVDDGARGTGVGKMLLHAALDFCDARGFAETRLWTFQGLDAARHLYEHNGFTLAEEYEGGQWGTKVLEQVFVRARRG